MDFRSKTVVLFLLLVSSSPVLSGNTWFIEGGTIFTGTDRIIEDGVIRIEGESITYVGRRLDPPSDALVLEARGKFITPGFIVANTNIGVPPTTVETGAPSEEITPGYRIYDILDADHPGFQEAVEHGITCVNVMPRSYSAMPGVGTLIKTAGSGLKDRVLREVSALSIQLVQEHRRNIQADSPGDLATEVAAIIRIRNSFNVARERRTEIQNGGNGTITGHQRMLVTALNQEIPSFIYANSPTEIERGYSLYEDYQLRPVFLHIGRVEEVWERFAGSRMPIITGPLHATDYSPVGFHIPPELVQRLRAEGLPVHIQPDAFGEDETGGLRDLQYQAALLQTTGMSWQEALRSITRVPAELLGVDNRIGTIEVGMDADLNIFGSHPLLELTPPDLVVVNGEVITAESKR